MATATGPSDRANQPEGDFFDDLEVLYNRPLRQGHLAGMEPFAYRAAASKAEVV